MGSQNFATLQNLLTLRWDHRTLLLLTGITELCYFKMGSQNFATLQNFVTLRWDHRTLLLPAGIPKPADDQKVENGKRDGSRRLESKDHLCEIDTR